jgi:hypothetical protein
MDNKFIASAVVVGVAGQRSCLQLYNPVGSGVEVHFQKFNLAWTAEDTVPLTHSGFDLRQSAGASGAFFKFGKNKRIGKPASQAMIFKGNCPAELLPAGSGIIYEPWPNSVEGGIPKLFDRPPYELTPGEPFIIEPGMGVTIAAAHDQTYLITTLEFSEHPFTEEESETDGLIDGAVGAVHTNLSNGALAFDADEATSATDAGATSFYIGKVWAAPVAVTRVVLKSPTGRSFSAANPGRVFTWFLETFDGSAWSTHSTGTYTEPGVGAVQSEIDLAVSVTAHGHRLRMVDTGIATHKVGLMAFFGA